MLQSDLLELEKWENEWDMKFHPDKCNVLHVSRSRKPEKSDYYLHGHKLESVSTTKYLGVTLSDDGEFTEHLKNVTNNGNQMLGFIRRNLRVNSKSVKDLAYKMLVRPSRVNLATLRLFSKNCHPRPSSMSVTLLVLRCLFVTMRAARRWTFSRLVMCSCL